MRTFAPCALVMFLVGCDAVLPLGDMPCGDFCGDASTDRGIPDGRTDSGGPHDSGTAPGSDGGGSPEPDPDAGAPVCDGGVCECIGTFRKGDTCVRASSLTVDWTRACAVADGTGFCWGVKVPEANPRFVRTPQAHPGLNGIGAITLESQHACALTAQGGVRCWGDGHSGQLGYKTDTLSSVTAQDVTDLTSGARQVLAGGETSCAVLLDGKARCWGTNQRGELGAGASSSGTFATIKPFDVRLDAPIVDMRVAYGYSCAVLDTGSVACWGAGGVRWLGKDTNEKHYDPVLIPGVTGARRIMLGWATCIIDRANVVACWGGNNDGLLGDTSVPNRANPIAIPTAPAADIWTDRYGKYACIRTTNHGAQCWGATPAGKIVPSAGANLDVPSLTSNVERLGLGAATACAVLTDGGVRCWGDGTHGELGNGATGTRSNEPVSVVGLPEPMVDVQIGFRGVCALSRTGRVFCWGGNDHGELGTGSEALESGTPAPVRSR